MATLTEAAEDFLTSRRIAVTGVSREPRGHGGNPVFERLRDRGYEVYAVNPNADEVAGVVAYPNLSAIPGGVDAVVIATAPDQAMATVQEAANLGVTKVWMHRGFGPGSTSPEAATWGKDHGLTVIEAGCPLMFGATADGGHRFMCRALRLFGKLPRTV